MNWVDKLTARTWSILVIGMLAFAISGCEGDTGPQGAAGPQGLQGPEGPEGPPGPVPDDVQAAIDSADPESCSTCHAGVGDGHQAVYDQYVDASVYVLTIDNVQSAAAGGGWDLTIDFSIDYNGMPLIDPVGTAPSAQTLSFAPTKYDGGAVEFQQPGFSPFPGIDASGALSNGDGTYTLIVNVEYDIDSWTGGAIVGRIANGDLDFPDGPTSHFGVYQNLSHDAFEFGVLAWESAANVEGCEACHGAPYRKHGNIEASVAGTADFVRCKSCHFDDRTGGHEDWQYMVDDPFNWATGVGATRDYAYIANLMNDTHMSHAMEFPYPQSMSNCSTCHEGKLTQILDDDFFQLETCKSCHVIEGTDAWPEDAGNVTEGMYAQPHRPPPMTYLWTVAGVDSYHNVDMDCQNCHGTDGFSAFADMHSGYDDHIYDDNGVKFADLYTVSIDNLSMAGNVLTIDFSASDANIAAEVLVSLYGWDTKHFIVASHTSDGSDLCIDRRGNPGGCRMEFAPGDTNPLFTDNSVGAGDYSVDLDLGAYVPTEFLTDDIPTLIADGVIKKAEITITPELELDGEDVVLKAVDETFDVNAFAIVDDYFKGANQIVSVEKCNACHDSLASTFHDGSGRGGDGIEVCKNCHVTTSPGSHIELASRAIDSYVHAIHTFQPFDEDDVYNANDPVFNARNEQHKHHTFPNFTALSCEACHVSDVYNVPDQSQSMPGVLRASWTLDDPSVRAIGTIPEYVTGPASRACGGCHRADMVVHDAAGDLASFNAHTGSFGTLEENDSDDLALYGIIDKIMSMFE